MAQRQAGGHCHAAFHDWVEGTGRQVPPVPICMSWLHLRTLSSCIRSIEHMCFSGKRCSLDSAASHLPDCPAAAAI